METLSQNKFSLAGIFLIAFLLRAGYSLRLPASSQPPDASSFDTIAWNLASQGEYIYQNPLPTALRPPSYVVFLAAIYKAAGHHFQAALLIQALMGATLVLLLMDLTRRFTSNPRAPWITGGIAAFYPFFIYYEGELISDSFLTFWLVLSIWFFIRWREKPDTLSRAIACGLSFSILALGKTVFIPLFAMVLAIEILRAAGKSTRFREARTLFIMGLVFVTPIFLWGVRNQRIFGRFLLDTHGGITSVETIMFYDQCKQGTFGPFFANHPLRLATVNMNEAEKDAFYLDQTKQWIRDHPRRFLRQSLGNLKNFWRFYPRQDIQFKEGQRKLTIISLLTEPFLILVGFVGLIKTRKRWRLLYPTYLTILMLSGIHALTTGQMRYRLPLMPFLILFAVLAFMPLSPGENEMTMRTYLA